MGRPMRNYLAARLEGDCQRSPVPVSGLALGRRASLLKELRAVQLDPVKDDLIWDDGTMNKEPVLDIYAAEHITLVRPLHSAA